MTTCNKCDDASTHVIFDEPLCDKHYLEWNQYNINEKFNTIDETGIEWIIIIKRNSDGVRYFETSCGCEIKSVDEFNGDYRLVAMNKKLKRVFKE